MNITAPSTKCSVSHLVCKFSCSHFQHIFQSLSFMMRNTVFKYVDLKSLSWPQLNRTNSAAPLLHVIFRCENLHLLYVILHIILPDSKSASDDQMMEKSVIIHPGVQCNNAIHSKRSFVFSIDRSTNIIFIKIWIHRQKHTSKCLWKPVCCHKLAQFIVPKCLALGLYV